MISVNKNKILICAIIRILYKHIHYLFYSLRNCEKYEIMFDFVLSIFEKLSISLNKESLYHCVCVLSNILNI